MPAEEWIDEWAPPGLDWRHLVDTYPVPTMAAAGVAGFWLGRHHGRAVLTAFAAFAGRQLGELVDREMRSGAGTS